MKLLRSALLFSAIVLNVAAAQTSSTPISIALDNLSAQHPRNVATEVTTFKGLKALKVSDIAGPQVQDGVQLVLLDHTDLQDGTIELKMSGEPKPGSVSTDPRGFVGLAFRLHMDPKSSVPIYEAFYLRPTNGRADDQVRRNHATQYISYPNRPWYELRKDSPGKYESYADMVAGDWINVRIEIHGRRADLYVGDATQPTLVVNDLTQQSGQIALWVGTETVAYFADLRISRTAN